MRKSVNTTYPLNISNIRFITSFIFFVTMLSTIPALAQKPAAHHSQSSLFAYAELSVISMVEWLKLAVETIGALIIALGVVVAVSTFIRAWIVQRQPDFNNINWGRSPIKSTFITGYFQVYLQKSK